jgi:arylsulfatase
VPTDRPIDGIDASSFLLGESETSGRESYLFFGPDGSLMSAKWHNVKVVLHYSEGIDQPIVKPQWPMLFDLASDPNELYNLMATKMDMGWMMGVALKFVADYQKSTAQYPNIKTGQDFRGYE